MACGCLHLKWAGHGRCTPVTPRSWHNGWCGASNRGFLSGRRVLTAGFLHYSSSHICAKHYCGLYIYKMQGKTHGTTMQCTTSTLSHYTCSWRNRRLTTVCCPLSSQMPTCWCIYCLRSMQVKTSNCSEMLLLSCLLHLNLNLMRQRIQLIHWRYTGEKLKACVGDTSVSTSTSYKLLFVEVITTSSSVLCRSCSLPVLPVVIALELRLYLTVIYYCIGRYCCCWATAVIIVTYC